MDQYMWMYGWGWGYPKSKYVDMNHRIKIELKVNLKFEKFSSKCQSNFLKRYEEIRLGLKNE